MTQLIGPVRQYQLIQRHIDRVSAELMDNISNLLGIAFHDLMARYSRSEHAEQLLTAEYDGVLVSGKPDDYEGATIIDYKTTKAYSYAYEKPEWEQQLNVYRWLAQKNGILITGAEIVAVFTDWTERRTYDINYPPYPAMRLPVPLWRRAETEAFLGERIAAHLGAMNVTDADLPPCTSEERWRREDAWAVYRTENATKAYRVYTSQLEAEAALSEFRHGRIERRPGKSARCERYCPVASFCSQWLAIQKAELEDALQSLAS